MKSCLNIYRSRTVFPERSLQPSINTFQWRSCLNLCYYLLLVDIFTKSYNFHLVRSEVHKTSTLKLLYDFWQTSSSCRGTCRPFVDTNCLERPSDETPCLTEANLLSSNKSHYEFLHILPSKLSVTGRVCKVNTQFLL